MFYNLIFYFNFIERFWNPAIYQPNLEANLKNILMFLSVFMSIQTTTLLRVSHWIERKTQSNKNCYAHCNYRKNVLPYNNGVVGIAFHRMYTLQKVSSKNVKRTGSRFLKTLWDWKSLFLFLLKGNLNKFTYFDGRISENF